MGDQESEIEDLERVFNTAKATPIKISYGALRLITQNFAQVIGSGTFGLVYLGKLQNGAMIAVKKLSLRIEDISNKKFLDEVDVLRRGYIAPELIDNQQISFKTDIYSLGITLVKLLTQSNEITENWHESLEQDCPQMKRCAQIALSCIKWDPKDRPTIREILDQLDDTETKFRKVDTAVYEPSKDPESSLYQV
nr:unnamed protein product [Digitaria exilis]